MISIRKRMALSFIFIILLTVLVLEVLIINIVRQSYYKNLEDSLFSQIKVSADLYRRYFSDASLYDNVLNNVDSYWKQADVEVQIADLEGSILMDSIGIIPPEGEKRKDVEEALKSGRGAWIGKVYYDDEMVLAVSHPLQSQEGTVGVLRFITSLREVNKDIERVSNVFMVIGAAVAFISAIISMLLANSIIGPLKEVTRVAEVMASGNFRTRSRKVYNDEIGKLSDTLNFMATEIIKRDNLKNDFISSVSHELRTPLTSIKGWAVTLKDSGPEDREMMADGLSIIEKESDRLTGMVEELLDFSRFVTGRIAMVKEWIHPEEVIDHVHKQMLPRAERDRIAFKVTVASGLPQILVDQNRLKQVFINILDNSFRFTPAGGSVAFTVSCTGGWVLFSVVDTGCGIAPDELPRVKEKFFKGKNSKSRNGIGLSICDEIVRLMGGTMEIRSEVNQGTEVLIALPVSQEGVAG